MYGAAGIGGTEGMAEGIGDIEGKGEEGVEGVEGVAGGRVCGGTGIW